MKTQAAIQSFLYNRRALNRRPRTIEWYESNLKRFADFCPELPLKPEPIEEFLSIIQGEPETKHGYYRALKALYRFICKRQRLLNPMELIDPPSCPEKVMPTLEPQEMMRMLNLPYTLRDRAILNLFIDNGARTSEIATLGSQNIGEYTIKVDGKRGQREIPISDETKRLLLALIATDGHSQYIFPDSSGQPVSRHAIYRLIRKFMKSAGIHGPKQGPHRIRHGFGKNYLVNGGDVRSLQKIMGHARISTTEKYTSLNLKDIIDKHRRFTPLRSAHAAAQDSFFNTSPIVKEAEEILGRKRR